ncbi:MAG: hydantoinase/oxoprolinase family protein, partial [Proteobacteria bacterium]|nr:hydantoinase/oxoprolinase family protein [Pseudomonadota bacterium]
IEMVEIGAGGGSIASVDELSRIQVGPQSAGSEPGPACYGRGGTDATVTDADLTMGRIDPETFAGGTLRLDTAAAARALAQSVGRALGMDTAESAFGVVEIVDENMANAARVHAIERGKTLGERTLVAFGGAAPLHAARLADKLGIARIIVPTNAGVGSAWGFLRAPVAYEVARSRYIRLTDFDPEAANAVIEEMRAEAYAVVRGGAPTGRLTETRSAMMRYIGQGHEISVPLPVRRLRKGDVRLLKSLFETHYNKHFNRVIPDGEVEALSWSITVSTVPPKPGHVRAVRKVRPPKPTGRRTLLEPETGRARAVPTYWRPDLGPGTAIKGPAVIGENETSTVVPKGFTATVNSLGYIVLERQGKRR